MYFYADNNNISGVIPESLGNLSNLRELSISRNNLQGDIPPSVGNCKILESLNLAGNNLQGNIPPSLENCKTLNVGLVLEFLQGQIPKSLVNCKNLKLLDLENNQLKDTFPCGLSALSQLQVLILKSNKFSGRIACPREDSIWPLLQILNLASNCFSGEITSQFIPIRRSTMAGTKEMQLEPDELKYSECSLLNLSHNSLSGNIPSSLGNLSQLESLDLSCNALGGNIPRELVKLNFLEYLNLSFNKLGGPIPTSTQLQSFDASSYKGNPGLYGPSLTPRQALGSIHPSMPSTSLDESQWGSNSQVEWMLRGAEVGLPVGLTIFIVPLLYFKRWRRWYCKHLDRLTMKILRRKDQARGTRTTRRSER
ncbi:LOW QUALITY PROTEIN: hypothetical protein Cgig2_000418 [Carnegiea gigantea]|uniref:Uncharacterized protein n=1 Tax=Carnegiea gigantea TaxID=171969 RepID=A0A9Q1GHX5_9CARY|nr:LOW QUALITY PROTEIN: hypothetical protein Cgig2_000418 [Carnegiea gigantea]